MTASPDMLTIRDLSCLLIPYEEQARYLQKSVAHAIMLRIKERGLPAPKRFEELRTLGAEDWFQITVSSPQEGASLEEVFSPDEIERVPRSQSRGPNHCYRIPYHALRSDISLIRVLTRLQLDLGWNGSWVWRGFQPVIDFEAGTLTCEDRSKSILERPLRYSRVPRNRVTVVEVAEDSRVLVFSLGDLFEGNRLGSFAHYVETRERALYERLCAKWGIALPEWWPTGADDGLDNDWNDEYPPSA